MLICKVALQGVLILLPTIDLIYEIAAKNVAPVHFVSAVVKILMLVWALLLTLKCKQKGLTSPAQLFYFWVLLLICNVMTFKSVLESGHVKGSEVILPFVTEVLYFPVIVAQFFLSCFADAKPTHISIDGKIETNL